MYYKSRKTAVICVPIHFKALKPEYYTDISSSVAKLCEVDKIFDSEFAPSNSSLTYYIRYGTYIWNKKINLSDMTVPIVAAQLG